jgi:hypothetical protein
VGLGIAVSFLGRAAGFDRDRSFYSTILIVVASYYALFAILGGSTRALVIESLVGSVFLVVAVLGFKGSLWLVVLGLVGHGVMDIFLHHHLVTNPGMPPWWPWFCMAIDLVMGSILAGLLMRSKINPT